MTTSNGGEGPYWVNFHVGEFGSLSTILVCSSAEKRKTRRRQPGSHEGDFLQLLGKKRSLDGGKGTGSVDSCARRLLGIMQKHDKGCLITR